MLAAIFVYGGIDALRHPETKLEAAQSAADWLGQPTDTTTLVRINGLVQTGAGLLLASDTVPRLASLALVTSLIPTTLADHPFWDLHDEADRRAQKTQFLKNLSMLGGLILAVVDTAGRPSVAWKARRSAAAAPGAIKSLSRRTRRTVSAALPN